MYYRKILGALCPVSFVLFIPTIHAGNGGSIAGTITNGSGASIAGAHLTLLNTAQHISWKTVSTKQGLYAFPSLPVGQYELSIESTGFSSQKRTAIAIDTDAAVRVDVSLGIAQRTDTVSVTANTENQVETSATHLGEVVSAAQMTSVPLNGRSYTDLLAIQPGVAPVSTLLPSSVIMAGVTGSLDPSGDLNPGNLSINGQRESANGFLVNGIDVQEHMNGGTSVIPNLDSIEEFRVLTTNFDAEYGNYNGGMITVVSKSGSSQFHGEAFEFFRNTVLDARGYFDPSRSVYRQNQFGGAGGGPIKCDQLFFFADYQGTRTTQGISTGNISVPSAAQRSGNFLEGNQNALTGNVSGPYLASLLSQQLGRTVATGEPYSSVFLDGVIPQSAWSTPAKNLLQYIPSPNSGTNQFSTAAYSQSVRDTKGAFRLDGNNRWGQFTGYYFIDDYHLDNPYPGSVAGASIPGFNALTIGRAQVFTFGHTKVLGISTVNEFHLGFLRNANIIGEPQGGLGVSLASQGFVTGSNTPGISVQAPPFEGIENITFPTFVMGVPITNLTQANNTYYIGDGVSHVMGAHTLKFGGQFHADQVNEHPNATFNGTFNINGTETGSAYADFLLGVASNFTQSSGQPFYLRNRYVGLYVQDNWRARRDLTINAGLRWDVIFPWWEKYNQLQTYIAGTQSKLFPGAPEGMVVAGDPGVPHTIAPVGYRNFAPRVGIAYSPSAEQGLLRTLLGGPGESSIRASFGMFYTAFPGLSAGIMYAVPPFGYNYLSPAPPLLATPFITAASGVDNGQRFPFPFPSHSVSTSNPDTSVDWSNFVPIAGDPFFDHNNRAAYVESYMLSLQRQLTPNALLTMSYVGNQGHHILALVSANPGDPALCLSLPGCGPFGEDAAYSNSHGEVVQGTRVGQGPNYGENTSDSSIANSNYNALESTLRYKRNGSQILVSYAYAKSIDQGSNLGEQLNPIDTRHSRAISAWDQRHSFVATYTWALPFVDAFRNQLTRGWSLSGTARFATGFPITLYDNSDNSLLGTLGNGANNYLLDTPQMTPGPLKINTNGRNGLPAFNTALFQEETLGQLGNSKRRMFYGPGIENFDMALEKITHFGDTRSLALRLEAFNVFNHAQFYGPASVNGQMGDPNFGQIVSAASPRLLQIATRLSF
ncbi:Outer membrane receptor proteins, mostly Fe transport [Terriglobus roseus]|uniref:Outer membrane receptor proteins, mostly Fe transport n=1 Tax=Terriglobus roseus TaxID=392734 RepID=A0A1G7HGZ7_9BACT|nr:Outer membrane receptor proteins, mostly Fe transport [Terriglobus roseus]